MTGPQLPSFCAGQRDAARGRLRSVGGGSMAVGAVAIGSRSPRSYRRPLSHSRRLRAARHVRESVRNLRPLRRERTSGTCTALIGLRICIRSRGFMCVVSKEGMFELVRRAHNRSNRCLNVDDRSSRLTLSELLAVSNHRSLSHDTDHPWQYSRPGLSVQPGLRPHHPPRLARPARVQPTAQLCPGGTSYGCEGRCVGRRRRCCRRHRRPHHRPHHHHHHLPTRRHRHHRPAYHHHLYRRPPHCPPHATLTTALATTSAASLSTTANATAYDASALPPSAATTMPTALPTPPPRKPPNLLPRRPHHPPVPPPPSPPPAERPTKGASQRATMARPVCIRFHCWHIWADYHLLCIHFCHLYCNLKIKSIPRPKWLPPL